MDRVHIYYIFLSLLSVHSSYGSAENGYPKESTGTCVQALNSVLDNNKELENKVKKLMDENGKLKSYADTLFETERVLETTKIALNETKKRLEQSLNTTSQLQEKFEGYEELTGILLETKYENLVALNKSKKELDACHLNTRRVQVLYDKCRATSTFKFHAGCQDLKESGYKENGHYIIDPDGAGAMKELNVECDMNGNQGETITILRHDSPLRYNVKNDVLSAGSYVRNVVYKASTEQISAVIDRSRECKQMIRYDCFKSKFHVRDGPVSNHDWYNRYGIATRSWGGAPPGSEWCSCGVNSSCDKPGMRCNCDAGDEQWRSDYGYITDKSSLPVTKMTFSGLKGNAQGYHTLGPLMCYG